MATYESTLSTEVQATTDLPAPSLDSVTANTSTIDVAWTAAHANGQTRVEYRDSGTSVWSVGDTVTYDTESATLTGIDNGTSIDVRVVATTPDANSPSGTLTNTTALPNEDQPVLLNGVEDEVGVDRESAVTNAGDIRIQIRETGQSAWDTSAVGYAEQTVSYDTLTTQFTGREDGEEYEVRARTETDDVTGAWTEPVSIITKFPGSNNLSATIVSSTQVDLGWDDNADNEIGQLVVREQRLTDGRWSRERVVEDVGPNTETFADNTVQPDREYRYRIRSFTDNAQAESNLVTAETPALDGVRDRRVPASGWRVEVGHPDADQPLTPTVLDGAEWNPRLNAKPQVRIPVPRSSTWEDADVEGSEVRVWKDGTRLPIDELQTTERDETQDVLVAVGGTKLEDDVEGIEYPSEDAHVAAEEVIEQELGWVANVDDPQTDAREDVRLFQASDTGDFEDALGGADPFPATSPLTVQDNEAFALPTGWFREAEDADYSGTVNTTQSGEWSGGQSVRLSSGDACEIDFQVQHTIPEGEATATIVYGIPSGEAPGLEFTRTNPGGAETVVESFSQGGINDTGGQFELTSFEVTFNDDGPLEPGSYDFEVRIPVTSGGELYLDFLHARDARYPIDEDTTPVDGVVTGWQQRPADVDVVFDPITSVEQVVAAEIDVDMAGGGPVALGLRNDQTAAFDEGSGTTHTATFAEPSQLLQARVTLGREDSGTTSGEFGDESHRLEFLDLFADLVNTPVLIDFVHRGTYEELLNRIANAGDSIWELRRAAPSADAEYRIEWTHPGQRVADAEPELVSFNGQRSIEGSYQRVIAEGKTSAVEGETFTANSYGLNVGLNDSPVDTGSETVYDVGDRSTQYERNLDYTLDHSQGAITILEGGSMTPGTEYAIDYEWRFEGEYAQPAVDNPDTLREQFADAASDRECEQLALAVVREVAAPLEEAEVTIRETDPDRSLVESIPADQLPFEGPLKVRDIASDAREETLTLGSRETAGDVVDELRGRLSAVARNI